MKKETPASILNSISNNEDLLRAYAVKKCKDCLGRGYIEIAFPGEPVDKYVCECVKKSVKREFVE